MKKIMMWTFLFLLLWSLSVCMAETVVKPDFIIEKFTLSSVAASGTGSEETLNLSGYSKGIIKNLRIASSSTNYKISIRNKTGASADTINEILVYSAINKDTSDDTLSLFFENQDTTVVSKLYAIITNSDGTNATGSLSLEIGIER